MGIHCIVCVTLSPRFTFFWNEYICIIYYYLWDSFHKYCIMHCRCRCRFSLNLIWTTEQQLSMKPFKCYTLCHLLHCAIGCCCCCCCFSSAAVIPKMTFIMNNMKKTSTTLYTFCHWNLRRFRCIFEWLNIWTPKLFLIHQWQRTLFHFETVVLLAVDINASFIKHPLYFIRISFRCPAWISKK